MGVRLRQKSFDRMLIALGVAALLCSILPALAMVAAISIIGIPVALAMAAIPALFTFLLTARLASIVMPHRLRWLTSGILAAGVLAVPAHLVNKRLDAETAALVGADHDDLARPFAPRVVAVRSDSLGRSGGKEAQCDDFCLRALLAGAADRVIAVKFDPAAPDLDLAASGPGFRLERRSICPPVTLRDDHNRIEIEKTSGRERLPTAAEVMRLEIAKGNCLVEEPARIDAADAILTAGYLRRGVNAYRAGLDVFADTITAERITVHSRSGDGFAETYRRTGVSLFRHLPLLLPTYVTGYSFDIGMGFQRLTKRVNIDDRYAERPDWTAFLTETLGLDLAIADKAPKGSGGNVLVARLKTDGPLDPAVRQLAGDFFRGILLRSRMSQQEADQAVVMLRDRRLAMPSDVAVVGRLSATVDAATQVAIADALFERLFALDVGAAEHVRSPEASGLGGAIAGLPDDVVRPRRNELERLARDPHRRVAAYQALRKLSIYGADAVPTLLYLIDDAGRQGRQSGNNWQHPYLAGLDGICRAQPDGREAVGPLLERLDRGQLPVHASYGRMLVSTFAAAGEDADRIWPRMKAAGYAEERSRFDRLFQRAQRKPDCSY